SPRDIARDVLYYGYSTNRDPHSFPTRRSSDLNYRMTLHAAAHREASLLGLEGEAFANKVAEMLLNPPAHVADEATKMAAINTFRSEEHTSELQSRENLVCRLLLEKKKA